MAEGNQFQTFDPSWWRQVLEEVEPLQYYSSPKGMEFASRSPSQRRFFGNAYQDILQDYYGQAGTTMRKGRAPSTFMEFLEANDPFTARYSQLPQTARGVTGMTSNPRTRYLFNY